MPCLHRLPPRVEGDADGGRAETGDRIELGPRCVVWSDDVRRERPSSRAIQATPCAMLPALVVQTPFAHCSGVAWRIALDAPRILNEPIGWRHSSLSQISAGPVDGEASRAASVARHPRSSPVRARSRRARSEVDLGAPPELGCPADDELGRREILDRKPERLEERQLVRRRFVPAAVPVRSSPSSARMWSGPIPCSSTALR